MGPDDSERGQVLWSASLRQSDADADSYANADSDADSYSDGDSNGYVHPDAVGYVHPDANGNARAEGNAYSEAPALVTAAPVGRNTKLELL